MVGNHAAKLGSREKRTGARGETLRANCGCKCAESRQDNCAREDAQLARKFHGILKDESDQDFICRFAVAARGFTPEQLVRIGDVADMGQPGALTALAAKYGRSLLDVVAVARDFPVDPAEYRAVRR